MDKNVKSGMLYRAAAENEHFRTDALRRAPLPLMTARRAWQDALVEGFAWAASAIAQHLSPSHRPIFVVCAILTIVMCAVGDGTMFQIHFVRPDLQDLSIHMVLTGSNS